MSFCRFVAGILTLCLFAAPASAQVASGHSADPPGPAAPPPPAAAPFDINTIDPESFRSIAIRIPAGETAPVIDGRLDDAIWQQAPVSGQFIQREPTFGAPASERTEFRVLYDDRRIYFAFWAYDSDARHIRASELKRDSLLTKGDQIKFNIDTFHDRRNAFYFSTNPLGAYKDSNSIENGRVINYDWNAVWQCKTSIDDAGWYAEIAIPLSQLRFKTNPGEATWGLNVSRIIIRKNEDTYWVPYPREWGTAGFARVEHAGLLTGLTNVRARRRFEFLPYVAPQYARNYEAGTPGDLTAHGGFDLRMGVTSDLTADLTYKTDFAQVEADQEVVNLSRFSLFFPEKRQFFTESLGIFSFGQAAERPSGVTEQTAGLLSLFYSRRIGLVEGREIPILAGGKLTGRAGPYTLGFMNVETESASLGVDPLQRHQVPSANFTVARVKRNILASSQVGAILLNRQGGAGGEFNRSIGVDGSFLFGTRTALTGLFAKTSSPDSHGKDMAGAFDMVWRVDAFNWGATYLDVGERFDAQMGFVPRIDIRNAKAKAAWTPRPKWKGVRQVTLQGSVDYFENHAGTPQSRNAGLDFTIARQDSSTLNLSVEREYDLLPFDWRVGLGVVPAGGYGWNTFKVNYASDKSRRVYGGLNVDLGGYYSGNKRTYAVNLNVLPLPTLLVETQYTRNEVRLPASPLYSTNVFSTRASYSLSPDLFLKAFVQYNDERRLASFNALFWYVYRPGSDLYIVYNEGWNTDLPGPLVPRTRNRSLSIKMTYWLAR